MAISQVAYYILKKAFSLGVFNNARSVLELGEANFYGDFPVGDIEDDVKELIVDENECQKLIEQLRDKTNPDHSFNVAKVIYRTLFNAQNIVSIDLNGTHNSIRSDLNEPVEMDQTFDITINNGTAEHVFNIGQVFKTIHERTVLNGIMIHESPFTDWFNHGFYNLQPTLYYDIAEANNYVIMGLFCCTHLPPTVTQVESPQGLLKLVEEKKIHDNSVLYVLMRKNSDAAFKYPMQGYYEGRLDANQNDAWENLRFKSTVHL